MLSKAQIKYIHSLQHKKYRQKFNQFIAEGDKTVRELLQGNEVQIAAVYALPEWIAQYASLAGDIAPEAVTPEELQRISALSTPNQALALVHMPSGSNPLSLQGRLTLALETIQDPGNMGTIIRIADWFGIRQVFCSPDCADPFQPKAVQASMGSIGRVLVTAASLPSLLQQYPHIAAYAATLQGEDINSFSRAEEGILLVGNESRGLSPELASLCRYRVTIPRIGRAESLNAAVATGILCAKLCL